MQSVKTNFFSFFLLAGLVFGLFSCQKPSSKEDYLQNFKSFVKRVERHHEDYSKKDWRWADERYELYSNVWYNEFENDFTTNEKIEVITLKLEYQNLKEPSVISNLLKSLKEENVDEIKQKIDDYIDNDFDEDVEKLMDGMKEIGDSAVKVFEDIIEEIDKQF